MEKTEKINLSSNQVQQCIVICITFVFLFFPILHDLKPIFKENAPYGVAHIDNKLTLSKKAFLSGKFQKKASDLAKKRSGYWKPFTLIGNQLLLIGFNQITAFHNNSVFMGNDGQLIQTMHLSAFNRLPDKSIDSTKTAERIKKIKFLQDYQAAKGKSVVTVISPNVIELYPETLPDRYKSDERDSLKSSYELMKQQLDNAGINYIDSPKILLELKDKYPFKMFGKTASHWNDVASCLVLSQLNDSLLKRSTANFPDFKCEPWEFESPPRDKDLDLIKIANLLFPSMYYEPMPYVRISSDKVENNKKLKLPEVTLSGSSYLFAFAEAMNKFNLSSNHVHYFYYRQRRSKGMRGFGPLRKKEMDWGKILDREITIIDAPMRQPTSFGYGFVEDAYNYLNKNQTAKTKKSKF
jgi:hypothetical protein